MKDISKLKDYKMKYKRYYGIDFDSKKYEIHHLDLNHNNNGIENLLLLPKDLHHKYHFYLSSVVNQSIGNGRIHSSIQSSENYLINCLLKFIPIYQECNKWYDYKLFLDGIIPNIHNIKI